MSVSSRCRSGWTVVAAGVLASFLTPWFWVVIVAGAVIVIVDGLRDALHNTSPETLAQVIDGCGYDDTPHGQQAIEDAPHFRAWERQLAGTWPNDAGAVE
ncbi:MAG: hypothetical protein PGN37_20395 [Mycobacterium kyogaense]|uniref:hypothetical protein n=1 Tax=Mycobacterium kyogaense TaxID=2212479 RepID=UPI002FF60799